MKPYFAAAFAVALSCAAAPAFAQNAAEPAIRPIGDLDGQWEASGAGVARQKVRLRVLQEAAYRFAASMDVISAVSQEDIPVRGFARWGDSVRFVISIDKRDVFYAGRVAGEEIVGRWEEAGASVPLRLRRVSRASDPRRPQERTGPGEVEVTLAGGDPGVTLTGTLALPVGAGPHPAVLLLSGSGPQDRDETIDGHKPFKVLSNYLVARGIAVLRLDDRGIGGSTGRFDAGLPELVRDALAGVALLRSRQEVRRDAIGLVGHSQGGVVAPLTALQSRDVAYLVLLAAPGRSYEDVVATQSRDILASERADTARVAATLALHRARREIMAAGGDSATLRAALMQLATRHFAAYAGMSTEQRSASARLVVASWLSPAQRSLAQYDPAATFGRVTVPVLALNGERDMQVAAKPNLGAIEAALRAGGNTRVTTVELPGLNHMFQHATTGAMSEYATIQESFAPEALQAIGDWILKAVPAH